MIKRGWFITGTDTGIGKTTFSSILLRSLNQQGCRAVGLKPIASGVIKNAREWVNQDALILQKASAGKPSIKIINPICFEPAIAPHIAAGQQGVKLTVAKVLKHCRTALNQNADAVVIEGAGGLLVPLNRQETMLDLIKAFGFPAIVVVGLKLGCLNHAILTLQVLKQHQVPVAGWVANMIDPTMSAFEENIETLSQYFLQPPMAVLPHQVQQSKLEASLLMKLLSDFKPARYRQNHSALYQN